MGILPDTYNYALCMRWECRAPFPRHRGLAIPTCITTREIFSWDTGDSFVIAALCLVQIKNIVISIIHSFINLANKLIYTLHKE